MRSFVLTAMVLAATSAFATGSPPPKKPVPNPTYFLQGQNQELYNNPINTLTANPVSNSSSNSESNQNQSQSYNHDGGNTYFFPAPVTAAPLPPGLCPKGDSESFSFVWGFVSYAKSSTRTEMECLEKVLAAIKPEVKIVEKVVEVPVEKTVYVEQKCPTPAPKAKPQAKKVTAQKVCK